MAKVSGKCKWFDRKKGYGFIECDGGKDIFVHQTEIKMEGFRALYPDQEVEFVIKTGGPSSRDCAVDVTGPSGSDLSATRASQPRKARKPKEAAPAAKEDAAAPAAAADKKKKKKKKSNPRKRRNAAFVFIKPHANTELVRKMVSETLASKGISIAKEGTLAAEEIDSKKLIDQHYYAIASKATILKPKDLNVPEDKFEEFFKLSWKKALGDGVVFNAMDGCTHLGITSAQLNDKWAECKKSKQLIKFGGGFYCGKVSEGKKTCYIFNGFFMSMREAFTKPGTSIYYYSVHWDPAKLSWADFRGKLLGPTDPQEAPKDSLRGLVLAQWKELGLKSEPNTGDNAVHASASPFEGLAERMNWLGMTPKDDFFGRDLLKAGLDEKTISDWSVDPQVQLVVGGSKGSLFDALEDLDVSACIDQCTALFKAQS